MIQVMTIAGSDSGGGAGIQADLKTFAAMGVFGLSAVTAVTAQNTREVTHIHEVPVESVRAQIRALFDDFEIAVVKTGMLPSAAIIECVAEELERAGKRPLVVDPVMVATSRAELMRSGALSAMTERLLPMAALVTPNIFEASAMAEIEVSSVDGMREAALKIGEQVPGAVLVKGGDLTGDESVDILHVGNELHEYGAPRIESRNTHGTGCTYAAAIAARIALGEDVIQAVRNARAYVIEAIRHGVDVGHGHGPTGHFYFMPVWEAPNDREE